MGVLGIYVRGLALCVYTYIYICRYLYTACMRTCICMCIYIDMQIRWMEEILHHLRPPKYCDYHYWVDIRWCKISSSTVCISLFTCVYVHVCVCMYVYIYIHIDIYIYIYVYVYYTWFIEELHRDRVPSSHDCSRVKDAYTLNPRP